MGLAAVTPMGLMRLATDLAAVTTTGRRPAAVSPAGPRNHSMPAGLGQAGNSSTVVIPAQAGIRVRLTDAALRPQRKIRRQTARSGSYRRRYDDMTGWTRQTARSGSYPSSRAGRRRCPKMPASGIAKPGSSGVVSASPTPRMPRST